uniref:Uncharacterized protein n=1 Tax=Chromera velia CCMP2878 TaxID=1169474 RepID=A0A0G4HN17_9ALVE|eukprot:Cvel_7630.t1-p1 / transcript=Cvel_7630.t1 / gene=Cvel_7630 / organism=Chromera_velia_CCMP2878 / gene_product=Regulator of nonsense transcripts 1 homolog, putative / transcript_product=Regulator of nonsense transcripts 1 homolog, putative / location=Cvel_scaffold403:9729-26662(+) / protein_length=2176 / sequence_SO=supercontig / SO=protein_coding / is_pseudo=false
MEFFGQLPLAEGNPRDAAAMETRKRNHLHAALLPVRLAGTLVLLICFSCYVAPSSAFNLALFPQRQAGLFPSCTRGGREPFKAVAHHTSLFGRRKKETVLRGESEQQQQPKEQKEGDVLPGASPPFSRENPPVFPPRAYLDDTGVWRVEGTNGEKTGVVHQTAEEIERAMWSRFTGPPRPSGYDAQAPVDVRVLNRLLEMTRRAPTSFNSQPWKVVVLSDRDDKVTRHRLSKAFVGGRNQERVVAAPVVLFFLADLHAALRGRDIGERFVNDLVESQKRLRIWAGGKMKEVEKGRFAAFQKLLPLFILFFSGCIPILPLRIVLFLLRKVCSVCLGLVTAMPAVPTAAQWAEKNAMLPALSFCLAATSVGLLTAMLEGFDSVKVRSVLGIPSRFSLPVAVIMGYPSRESPETNFSGLLPLSGEREGGKEGGEGVSGQGTPFLNSRFSLGGRGQGEAEADDDEEEDKEAAVQNRGRGKGKRKGAGIQDLSEFVSSSAGGGPSSSSSRKPSMLSGESGEGEEEEEEEEGELSMASFVSSERREAGEMYEGGRWDDEREEEEEEEVEQEEEDEEEEEEDFDDDEEDEDLDDDDDDEYDDDEDDGDEDEEEELEEEEGSVRGQVVKKEGGEDEEEEEDGEELDEDEVDEEPDSASASPQEKESGGSSVADPGVLSEEEEKRLRLEDEQRRKQKRKTLRRLQREEMEYEKSFFKGTKGDLAFLAGSTMPYGSDDSYSSTDDAPIFSDEGGAQSAMKVIGGSTSSRQRRKEEQEEAQKRAEALLADETMKQKLIETFKEQALGLWGSNTTMASRELERRKHLDVPDDDPGYDPLAKEDSSMGPFQAERARLLEVIDVLRQQEAAPTRMMQRRSRRPWGNQARSKAEKPPTKPQKPPPNSIPFVREQYKRKMALWKHEKRRWNAQKQEDIQSKNNARTYDTDVLTLTGSAGDWKQKFAFLTRSLKNAEEEVKEEKEDPLESVFAAAGEKGAGAESGDEYPKEESGKDILKLDDEWWMTEQGLDQRQFDRLVQQSEKNRRAVDFALHFGNLLQEEIHAEDEQTIDRLKFWEKRRLMDEGITLFKLQCRIFKKHFKEVVLRFRRPLRPLEWMGEEDDEDQFLDDSAAVVDDADEEDASLANFDKSLSEFLVNRQKGDESVPDTEAEGKDEQEDEDDEDIEDEFKPLPPPPDEEQMDRPLGATTTTVEAPSPRLSKSRQRRRSSQRGVDEDAEDIDDTFITEETLVETFEDEEADAEVMIDKDEGEEETALFPKSFFSTGVEGAGSAILSNLPSSQNTTEDGARKKKGKDMYLPPLPFHVFSPGDLLAITRGNKGPIDQDVESFQGEMYHCKKKFIDVVVQDPPDWITSKWSTELFRIDRFNNRICHGRMMDAVLRFTNIKDQSGALMNPLLREALLRSFHFFNQLREEVGAKALLPSDPRAFYRDTVDAGERIEDDSRIPLDRKRPWVSFFATNPRKWWYSKVVLDEILDRAKKRGLLDPSQDVAVRAALSRRLTLIQGPPGTGKTRTSCLILGTLAQMMRTARLRGHEPVNRFEKLFTIESKEKEQALRSIPPQPPKLEKILAAAFSNVAADNILEGLLKMGVKAVRVGRSNVVNPLLYNYTADALVRQHPEVKAAVRHLREVSDRARELRLFGMKPDEKGPLLPQGVARNETEELLTFKEKEFARKKKMQEHVRLAEEDVRVAEKRALWRIMASADVVVSSCMGAGKVDFVNALECPGWDPERSPISFSTVLLDEASQVTEPAALVPLVTGAEQVILVGDQNQLPPTVTTESVKEKCLDVSLFVRLVLAGVKPFMLGRQYRMHPVIAAFPSAQFYGGKLESVPKAEDRPAPRGVLWPDRNAPVMMAAVTDETLHLESRADWKGGGDTTSYQNKREATVILQLLRSLLAEGEIKPTEIGVVAPYAAQVRHLRGLILEEFGAETAAQIEVKSVDGYQGREKEVVLFSAVRSNAFGNVGFLRDWRRLNVAITRARRGLVVVGDPLTLGFDENWESFIQFCSDRGLLVDEGLERAVDINTLADEFGGEVGGTRGELSEDLSAAGFGFGRRSAGTRFPSDGGFGDPFGQAALDYEMGLGDTGGSGWDRGGSGLGGFDTSIDWRDDEDEDFGKGFGGPGGGFAERWESKLRGKGVSWLDESGGDRLDGSIDDEPPLFAASAEEEEEEIFR